MKRSLFDITGKIALVTGSSRGLGKFFARGLAEAGATVVVNGRNAKTVSETVAAFRNEGFTVYGYPFDILDHDAVFTAVKEIEAEVGPISILVNNAGIQERKPLEAFPLESWKRIIDTNLTGVFVTSQVVVQGMIARRAGKIINICSLQSELGRSTIAPYAASKGGVKMLTRGMTVDWAQYNIQINGIGPGYFATEMNRALIEDEKFDSWLKKRTPMGRWGDPEELIGSLIYLASDASNFVNGQIVYVDGGILAAI